MTSHLYLACEKGLAGPGCALTCDCEFGTCNISASSLDSLCRCAVGYTGQLCDTMINRCARGTLPSRVLPYEAHFSRHLQISIFAMEIERIDCVNSRRPIVILSRARSRSRACAKMATILRRPTVRCAPVRLEETKAFTAVCFRSRRYRRMLERCWRRERLSGIHNQMRQYHRFLSLRLRARLYQEQHSGRETLLR